MSTFLKNIGKATNQISGQVKSTIESLKRSLDLPDAAGVTRQIGQEYRRSPLEAYKQAYPGHEVVADDVMSEDGSFVIGSICQVVADDSQMLMSRDALASVMAKVLYKQYPELKLANGKIIPIDRTSDGVIYGVSGTEIYEVVQLDYIGCMEIISDYSKGGPSADVVASRAFITVKMFGGQVNFSILEIIRVASSGLSLPDEKLKSLRYAFMKYLNAVGYHGDARGGLQGLLTLSGTTNYVVPTAVDFGTSADYLTSILADIAAKIPEVTNGIENPTRLVTPLRLKEIAMSSYRTGVEISVYEEFVNREQKAGRITDWVTDEHLRYADGGRSICLLVHDEIDKLALKVPQDFTMLDAQMDNFSYTVLAFGTTAGVVSSAPASVMKIYNMLALY
jgi:hypothetical protein